MTKASKAKKTAAAIVAVSQTASIDLWSGLLKLDTFAELLNVIAMAHDEKENPLARPIWSLYYSVRQIHDELEAAYNRLPN
jgi:hypothetical protein